MAQNPIFHRSPAVTSISTLVVSAKADFHWLPKLFTPPQVELKKKSSKINCPATSSGVLVSFGCLKNGD